MIILGLFIGIKERKNMGQKLKILMCFNYTSVLCWSGINKIHCMFDYKSTLPIKSRSLNIIITNSLKNYNKPLS